MSAIIQKKTNIERGKGNIKTRRAVSADANVLQRLYHEHLGTHADYLLCSIKESIKTNRVYVAVTEDDLIVGTLTSIKDFDCEYCSADFSSGEVLIGLFMETNAIFIGDYEIKFDDNVINKLCSLCVDFNYRRQGVAAALLEHALGEAQGLSYALVWAPGGEVRAPSLWEAYGFVYQEKVEDLGKLLPQFCANCMERKNSCTYCDCHVYVEKKRSNA